MHATLPLLKSTDLPAVRFADLLGTDRSGNPLAVAERCCGRTAGQVRAAGGAPSA
jgi:hypothetical protein